MNPLPTRHALLRDRKHWDASVISSLVPDGEGALTLLPLPVAKPPIALPGPYAVLPSGIACAACASALVADTAQHQILYDDGLCAIETRMPPTSHKGAGLGQFDTPRGLAFRPGRGLYVADSGNARVVLLHDPTLAMVATITAGLAQPLALAVDSLGRIIVADGMTGKLLRFTAGHVEDAVFNMAMAASGVAARFVATGGDDRVYVASSSGAFLHFAADATALPALAELDATIKAGAIAVQGDRVYAADTATGRILVLDRITGATLAAIPDFIGPVTALAACDDGSLLVKTGDDATYVRLAPGAYAGSGTVVAGPLDAGERDAWHFASAEADAPAQTSAQLWLYASDDASIPPAPADWVEAPAPAILVRNLFPAPARYLWLKVGLATLSSSVTPRLVQVRAETPGEDYLDELPEIYRKTDVPTHFLEHALALLRTQFDRSERIIDGLPLRVAIDFCPPAELAWLASWLGFAMPAGLASDEQRVLLHRVVSLYDRRGTPRGVAEFVHVYTGVRPRVIEAFTERHLWQLGIDSTLGFDTALAPSDAFGTIVPDTLALCASTPPSGCDEKARVTIGSVVVGASGPLAKDSGGAPLFADSAHRFRVVVQGFEAPEDEVRNAIRAVVDAEKPAHTEYALCFIEPAMRVGIQALIGFDTVVASEPTGATLAGMTLDLDAYLGRSSAAGRVGSQAQLGRDTRLG